MSVETITAKQILEKPPGANRGYKDPSMPRLGLEPNLVYN
jgi:hypothetical protein